MVDGIVPTKCLNRSLGEKHKNMRSSVERVETPCCVRFLPIVDAVEFKNSSTTLLRQVHDILQVYFEHQLWSDCCQIYIWVAPISTLFKLWRARCGATWTQLMTTFDSVRTVKQIGPQPHIGVWADSHSFVGTRFMWCFVWWMFYSRRGFDMCKKRWDHMNVAPPHVLTYAVTRVLQLVLSRERIQRGFCILLLWFYSVHCGETFAVLNGNQRDMWDAPM